MRIAWMVFLVIGCETSPGRFACGTKLEDLAEVAVCDRDKEVCICASNSCARRLDVDISCDSGYRYVEAPFARRDLADTCVPLEHVAKRIEQTAEVKTCEKAPVDAMGGGGM
jgi:hypothetical protein